jgi:hypothetical protein
MILFFKGNECMKALILFLLFLNFALQAEPPKKIPAEVYSAFTDNGNTPVLYCYRDDSVPHVGVRLI